MAVAPTFRFEHEMFEGVMSFLPSLFALQPGQRARALREQPVGCVIPDVILGIWSGELPKCDRLNGVARHILAFIAARKCVADQASLRRDLFLSDDAADSAVINLKQLGAIVEHDSGEVALHSRFDCFESVKIVAFEMKLRRWREALQQACAYRSFADEAYVVMDASQLRLNTEMLSRFTESNVGLILQHGTELLQIVSASRVCPEPSPERLFVLSKLAAPGPYSFA